MFIEHIMTACYLQSAPIPALHYLMAIPHVELRLKHWQRWLGL